MKTMLDNQIQEKLLEFFKGRIRVNEYLSRHTYIKIGGQVDLFLNPINIEELKKTVQFLNQENIPWVIIGKGSNLLAGDHRHSITVIELNSDFFKSLFIQADLVYAAAGVSLASFIAFNKNNRLSGSEFLAGIPGSIGGAVFMNAGSRGLYPLSSGKVCSVADIVVKIQVMDKNGNISIIARRDIDFSYRDCGLSDQIIIAAWFKLKPCLEQEITQNINTFLNNKIKTQELNIPNAGCIFKNPLGTKFSAGALIDKANLKGLAIGDAAVSSLHANFIINNGKANFSQVKDLILKIQETVKNKYSIHLELEVKIWDREGLK